MPVYDEKCNVSARIRTTRDVGMVHGGGSSDEPLKMQYIRKRMLEELQHGEVIVTSGENGNYLRDIPIGTISKITPVDYDSSLDIELSPILNFSQLTTVMVVDMKPLLLDKGGAQ
ncbi:MAG: hypothetical protein Ta2A_26800 [Treponemataceae bacterium]|nr:MAG: hypothetical protein Ta2A_26800 [Treponemataceae bacterium]